MAALSTYQGTTELTEAIPTELIPNFVQSFQYTPRVAEAIAWAEPGKGAIVRRFPRWNQLDAGSGVPASNKAESDTFTDVTLDMAESSITPGWVGFRLPVSDEGTMEVVEGLALMASDIAESLNALNDRIDSDVLSSNTSASNTAGAATDNFTAGKFRAAAAAYRALSIPDTSQGSAAVLHFDQVRDLEESVGDTAAIFTASEASSRLFGSVAGFKGDYHGFRLFETGNVPAESGGWSGCMTPIGRRKCGLGIVITQAPRVVPTRGDEAENRKVTFMVVSGFYGSGITNPARLLEVLGRT